MLCIGPEAANTKTRHSVAVKKKHHGRRPNDGCLAVNAAAAPSTAFETA